MQNQDAAIKKLEIQIEFLFKQAPGHNNCSNINSIPKEECQAITLRSGKELKETHKKPPEKKLDEENKGHEEAQTSTPKSHQEGEALKPCLSKAPYPQQLQLKKRGEDNQFSRFLEIFKKLQINIPFVEAIEQMPLYAKFLKELMTKKRSWKNNETVVLTEECSAIIQHKLPQKLKDTGSFQIPCIIGEITVEKALLEDLLVKVGDFIFPVDFVVLDMEEGAKTSIILGRPFLAPAGAIIDVQKGELVLRLHEEKMTFNVFKAMSYPHNSLGECMRLDSVEALVQETLEEELEASTEEELAASEEAATAEIHVQGMLEEKEERKEVPKLELKALLTTLKSAYLGENKSYPVIINSALSQEQEEELLQVLQKHKDAIGWTLADLK
ncbi:uncharacterized protein LOC130983606 [Arachis stenosperma]|uniref:uncharacterized protein LOC130983606 n=1 Tax=Arachis stenosperma TaxID=217475 RepID=UPI0025AB809F|nr:uncharacterized protein LOC130983606 [Arachis stenosperma]